MFLVFSFLLMCLCCWCILCVLCHHLLGLCLMGPNSLRHLGKCDLCLFYPTLFSTAMSMFLLLTLRTFRCFCSTFSWLGGMPCSSQAPSTCPLVWMGVSFHSSCIQVRHCISGASLLVSFSSPHLFRCLHWWGLCHQFWPVPSSLSLLLLCCRISASIWHMWFLVSALMSSFVALACSFITLALNHFAVGLFCMFSFA